ncbi:hypothetical protein [Chitinophaga sp.]|uniref:hypothetical protein n=1 Tax=Chitinophaga sp. TaxID=1869181 RepID=UPI002616C178|nr:hypothetical protein [uncultured Chitinophaga sp.]
MKHTTILAAAAITLAMACNNSQPAQNRDAAQDSAAQNVAAPEAPANPDTTVTGVVMEIQPGKDGYTALLKTEQDGRFFVTISHANLTDHASYKSAKTGDTLTVKGDYWIMESSNRITVRELK